MHISFPCSRRRFLRDSVLTCGAFTLPGIAPRAFGSVPTVQPFDLVAHKDDHTYLTQSIPLSYDSGHQLASFAIDSYNKCIFLAQLIDDGKQAGHVNKIGITKVKIGTNQVLGHMYITNAGHGTQIGVDVNGTTNHIWIESHPVKSSGLGTHISRVWFNNGATTDASNLPSGYMFNLAPGSTQNSCSFDPVWNRLVLRYHDGTNFRYNLYSFPDVLNNSSPTVLAQVVQPPNEATGIYYPSNQDFTQGFVSYGDCLYQLRGRSYANNCQPIDSSDQGDITITRINWNTGIVEQDHILCSWGKALNYREPEGMSLYIGDVTNPTTDLRLCAGLSSRTPCTNPTVKYANIYYQTP